MTKTLGNGVTTTYQYDDSGALTRMAHALAGSRSLAYAYQYDKAGNRTKIALADSAGTMSSDTAYSYDALNRLSNEVRTGGSGNFTKAYYYDSVGNRSMLVNVVNGVAELSFYTYNAGEQLTAVTKRVNGAVTESRSYEYDAAGQLTRMANAAGVTKVFSWDPMGRMTHADVNDGTTRSVDYAYNPVGKRYLRVENGVTKTWTYQGENIASVENLTSPTVHSVFTVHGLGSGDRTGGGGCGGGGGSAGGGGQIANVYERDDVNTAGAGSTTSRFYLYNHRGDVVGVCDASGNLTSAYDYDAYGAVSQSAQSGGGSAPTDDILFTGKDLDPDTGLYYFNARWYDSESGRFVSRTGLPPDVEGPYAFCSENPVGRADIDGLLDIDLSQLTDHEQEVLLQALLRLFDVLDATRLKEYYDALGDDILGDLELGQGPKVSFGDGKGDWVGLYNPCTGHITIEQKLLDGDPDYLARTLAHELGHKAAWWDLWPDHRTQAFLAQKMMFRRLREFNSKPMGGDETLLGDGQYGYLAELIGWEDVR